MSNLEQGTKEWLEMRKNYIGASDTAIILGVSKYKKTPYMLWQEKLGLIDIDSTSWATEYGKNTEPVARALYEQISGNYVAPMIVFHPTVDYLMASLDGLTIDEDLAVEIKCTNKENHELARKGIIPPEFKPQVYHQLECLGHSMMHYFSYNSGEGIIVEVHKDQEYQDFLKREVKKFWELVNNFTSPELSQDDLIEKDDIWQQVVQDLVAIKEIIKKYKFQEELLEEKLRELSQDKSSFYGNYKYTKSIRKGSIDYTSIPELIGVDVEKYRKPSTFLWKISVIDK